MPAFVKDSLPPASANPPLNTPPDDHRPQWVTVVPAGMGTATCEPTRSPDEADPHVVVCRAYEPPATSLVPVVPGSAVCIEIRSAAVARPFTMSFNALSVN